MASGASSAAALLPVMLLAAVLALADAAQDFPLLANVIFDVCGAGDFQIGPASPCHYHLFGISVAWSACSEAHAADGGGFRICMLGCVTSDVCKQACAEATPASAAVQCGDECGRVVSCVRGAADSATGQVSAETMTRECFTGSGGGSSPQASSFLAARGVARRMHLEQQMPLANVTFEPEENFKNLFPEDCQLHSTGGGAAWAQPLEAPAQPSGYGSRPLAIQQPPPPPPRFSGEVEAIVAARAASATPLPADWHLARAGVFLDPEATPMPGPSLPPALAPEQPNWWSEDAPVASSIFAPAGSEAQACPAVVELSGAEATEQGERMGTYLLTSEVPTQHQEGRPIYQHSNGQYLYYWAEFKMWRVGDSFDAAAAGLTSEASGAACPEDAGAWRVYSGGAWAAVSTVAVREVGALSMGALPSLSRSKASASRLSGSNISSGPRKTPVGAHSWSWWFR